MKIVTAMVESMNDFRTPASEPLLCFSSLQSQAGEGKTACGSMLSLSESRLGASRAGTGNQPTSPRKISLFIHRSAAVATTTAYTTSASASTSTNTNTNTKTQQIPP